MPLSAIVAGTKIEKSTVFRVLETLERDQYVKQDISGKYHITLKFVSMGLLHLEAIGLLGMCTPLLQELADTTEELAQLAIVDADSIRFVAKADGKGRIRVMPRLGTCAPLHATAVGKVWIASLARSRATQLVLQAGMEKFTPNTITNIAKLEQELRKIRWAGYAMNNEETFVGVKGIAVPICSERDPNRVIAALTVVAPSFRMSRERAISFYPLLKETADRFRSIESLLPASEAPIIEDAEPIFSSARSK